MKSLKSINSDIIVAASGAAIIVTFSVLLYLDFSRKMLAVGVKQIGTITFKREVAQRKYNSQVVWEKVEQHAPVYNFDSIRTADMSQAYIRLDDGTEINVDENSLILLSMAGDAVNINFAKGSMSATREGLSKDGTKKINITSNESTITMRDGELKMAKTEGKELDLTVNNGKAEVNTGKEKRSVGKDEKLIISADRGTKIVKLPLRLKSPSQNGFFISTERDHKVNFAWEPVENDPDITVEISQDIAFRKTAATAVVKGAAAALTLPAGSYYWRIRAKIRGDVDVSEVRAVTVIRDDPVVALAPRNGDTFGYSSRPPIIRFRWQRNALASAYILEIARDSAFKSLVKSIATPLTEIAVDEIPEGNYFWRVRTKVDAGKAAYNGMSRSIDFIVKKDAAADAPALMEPADGVKISLAMIEKKKLVFSWNANPSVAGFDIEIATDSDFRKRTLRRSLTGNLFIADTALKEGVYYWRVGARGASNAAPVYSAARTLAVVGAEKVVLISPRVLSNKGGQGGVRLSTVEFAWQKCESGVKYLFELSTDKGHTSNARRVVNDGTSVKVKNIGPGIYYWRVRALDKSRNHVAESDTANFNLSEDGVAATMDEILKAEKEALASVGKEDRTDDGSREKAEEDGAKKGDEIASDEEAGKKEAASKEEMRKEQARRDELKKDEIKKDETKKDERKTDVVKGDTVITVTSSVKGAEIYVDSKLAGTDQVTVPCAPGKVVVELKNKGYYPYRQEVQLRPGEKRKLLARMLIFQKGGKIRWTARLASSIMYRPVIQNNQVFVVTRKGDIACIGANGAQRWKVNLGGRIESVPAAGGQSIYVANVKGTVFSIRADSGKINWKFQCAGPLLFGSQPAFDGGKIYVATSFGNIYAITEDGKELWNKSLDEGVFGSIVFSSGILVVGTDKSRVYGINPKNGSIKWKFSTDGRIFNTSPRVFDGTLYIGSYSGTLYAVRVRSGSQLWKFKTSKPIYSTPRYANNMVFLATSGGIVYALDSKKGSKRWEFDAGGEITTDPDLKGESLYVAGKRSLFSLDINTGVVQWKETFRSGVNTAVTTTDKDVVVGLDNGDVTALSANPY